jgi:NADH-quinone oxidoreductase subunit N
MKADDAIALLPLLVQAGSVLLLLGAICVRRNHAAAVVISAACSIAALAVIPLAATRAPHAVLTFFIVDRFALFYMGLIFAGTFAVALLAHGYLERHGIRKEEFYLLLQAATTGAAVLAATTHFAAVFLGLELLSVSLYGMIAYIFNRPNSLEAAVKYLILAAASSAFLLLGMALIYAESGVMTFAGLAAGGRSVFALSGAALLMAGIGFKLALVPFHMWTPDIYQGAPVPVAAFLATVSKGAAVALLLRFALSTERTGADSLYVALASVAVASMLAGNLLALLQRNISRLLAYSSISHLGYVLVAIVAGDALGAEAVTFYVTSYLVTTLGAFGVISVLSTRRRDCNEVDDYRGLFWRRPGLAIVFTAMLLSLAGIPLTGGFIGKFFVVAAGVQASLWTLVFVLVAASIVGLFYYLRIVAAMFAEAPANPPPAAAAVAPTAGLLLGALSVLVVLLGVYPGPIVALIRSLLFPVP